MDDQSFELLQNFKSVPEFDSVVICPSKRSHNSTNSFDPSINGHDFFSRAISCSCTNKACNSKFEEDGCRRTRKNEYARQQMKKYREKIKQDPIRYMKYLQGERERNARRKIKKIQKIMSENGEQLSGEEYFKLQKREKNLLHIVKNLKNDSPLNNINNSQTSSNSSTNFLDTILDQMKSDKDSTESIQTDENETSPKINAISARCNPDKFELLDVSLDMKYDNNNLNGSFANFEIVTSFNEGCDEDCNEAWTTTTVKVEKDDEEIADIKEEIMSDSETIDLPLFNVNNCGFTHDEMTESTTSSELDYEFKFNRICAIVNCPSRFSFKDGIKYYPFPVQKDIRQCWLNLIKTKTKQWAVDSDSFVCSLHFAPAWFQKNSTYGNKFLLLNAVPTIFPNETAAQFDIDLPKITNDDFTNPECFKNFYEWSVMKLREQENLLKEQQLIVENQTESKYLQNKRIDKLMRVVAEFKKKFKCYKDPYYSDALRNIFEKMEDINADMKI